MPHIFIVKEKNSLNMNKERILFFYNTQWMILNIKIKIISFLDLNCTFNLCESIKK